MATLASVIKIAIDLQNMLGSFEDVTEQLSHLDNAIDKLDSKTPKITQFDNTLKDLQSTIDTQVKYKQEYEFEVFAAIDHEKINQMRDRMQTYGDVSQKVFDAAATDISKYADTIDKLPPKISSTTTALKLLQQGQDIQNLDKIGDAVDTTKIVEANQKVRDSFEKLWGKIIADVDNVKPKLSSIGDVLGRLEKNNLNIDAIPDVVGFDKNKFKDLNAISADKKLAQIADEARKLTPTMENLNKVTDDFIKIIGKKQDFQGNLKHINAWTDTLKNNIVNTAATDFGNSKFDLENSSNLFLMLDAYEAKITDIEDRIIDAGQLIDLSPVINQIRELADKELAKMSMQIKDNVKNFDDLENAALFLNKLLPQAINLPKIDGLISTSKEITEAMTTINLGFDKLTPNAKGFTQTLEILDRSIAFSNLHRGLLQTQPLLDKTKKELHDLGIEAAESFKQMNPSQEGIRNAIRQFNQIEETVNQVRTKLNDRTWGENIINTARQNLHEYEEDIAAAQTQTMFFSSTIIALQTMTLNMIKDSFQDVWEDITGFIWNTIEPIRNWITGILEYWGIMPDQVTKVIKVIAAVIVLIGLANTQTLGLYLTTSYWASLWNSNLVVMGITRVITLIRTATAMQWLFNAAMFASPIGLIVLAITAIIALIAAIIVSVGIWNWLWGSTVDNADQTARKVDMLNNATEKYKNHLKEILDYHKQQLSYTEKIRDAIQTPAQKAAQRKKELQNAIDEPQNIKKDIDLLSVEIEQRRQLIRITTDKDAKEALIERNKEAIKTMRELEDIQSKMKPLTSAEIEFQHKEIVRLEMEDRGIAKYVTEPTAAEKAINAKKNLDEIFDTNLFFNKNYNEMLDNIVNEFKDSLGIAKTPIKAFEESYKKLTDAIDHFNDNITDASKKLTDDEIIQAKQKLLDQLKIDLKIDKYLDFSDTTEARAKLIKQLNENIDLYAEKAGLSYEEINAAKLKMETEVISKTVYGKYIDTTSKVDELKNVKSVALQDYAEGIINDTQFDNIYDNIDKELKQFFGIPQKPIEKFNSLAVELEKAKNALNANKLAEAQKHLLDQLQKDLGIDKYFDMSDTTKVRAEMLKAMSENINLYADQAERMGQTVDQAAALQKLQTDVKKQGELGELYSKVYSDVKPTLDQMKTRLAEEIEAGIYTQEEAEKMLDYYKTQLNGKTEEPKIQQNVTNEAIVKGSVAYTNYQNENQSKQLEYTRNIRDNGKKQTELLAKVARNTERVNGEIFEVIA
jgi:hypothetical protein